MTSPSGTALLGETNPARRGRTPGARVTAPGRTQVLVMRTLAENVRSVRRLAVDLPSLTESSVRSAAMRLVDRDLAGFADGESRDARTFALTAKGRAVLAAIEAGDLEERVDA